ncbi:ArsR/SmtB family transcription factor [Lacisediminihabitans profunda]|uniref:Helix-turn-helix transcriptional regulator n=1 Tax=Lacisediminihabitans profunda TaxID=2594790 RepID=A0A5C8UUT6_9MICO|nr:helix-turn-helix domain-containing protein [Lacisediminihabitans profunda]TXN31406.1 helix-turn-helix transcriptional regulator [Lacisediminihabitans profunda]
MAENPTTESEEEDAHKAFAGRILDLESLKALAHPLRVHIVDMLSTYGSFTASGLADRLGESSGATSYHLRQLEKHGFVREVQGKGTGRERWWERTPVGINLSSREMKETTATPVGRAASDLVIQEWKRSRARVLDDFLERGPDLLPDAWLDVSTVSTMNTRLTREQMNELLEAWIALYGEYIEKYKGQEVPGARPVQIHFDAFPVVDGEETPDDAESARNPREDP